MRYLIKFTKEGEIKFVAHLDLLRTIQRMLKRSGLPVEYSRGFNPHINMSMAQPLAVGMYSAGDYFDAIFEEKVDEEKIKTSLNAAAPRGIKILEVVPIKEDILKKIFKSMAVIDGARYIITIKYEDTLSLNEEMKELLEKQEWDTIRKSKSGEKEMDIRKLIFEFNFTLIEGAMQIDTLVACGSRENLSAQLLATYIKENTSKVKIDSFVDIRREEMYAKENNKLIPLFQYVKGIF